MDGDDDYFDDEEFLEDEAELYVGDGGGGGGIALAGAWWDKEALKIAEEVCSTFDGELKIYAFKTLSNSTIQVRIERLTNRYLLLVLKELFGFQKIWTGSRIELCM